MIVGTAAYGSARASSTSKRERSRSSSGRRARHVAKNASSASWASAPPSKPRHSCAAGRRARSRRRSARGSTRRAARRSRSARTRNASTSGSQRRQHGVGRRRARPTSRAAAATRSRPRGSGRTRRTRSSVEFTKKKATLTGICSASHCAGRQPEVGEREVAVGHRPEVAAAGAVGREEQVAAAAGAHQAALLEVDEVAVLVGDRLGAQLAPLARPRLAARRGVSRIRCEHRERVGSAVIADVRDLRRHRSYDAARPSATGTSGLGGGRAPRRR